MASQSLPFFVIENLKKFRNSKKAQKIINMINKYFSKITKEISNQEGWYENRYYGASGKILKDKNYIYYKQKNFILKILLIIH